MLYPKKKHIKITKNYVSVSTLNSCLLVELRAECKKSRLMRNEDGMKSEMIELFENNCL